MKGERHSLGRMNIVADVPFYTEGPAVDSRGNCYCTTLTGEAILKIEESGKWVEWARSACPNGQIIVEDDQHLICDVKLSAIRRYDQAGRFIRNEIAGSCAGEKVFAPNDLVADASGNIYFTDSIRDKGKLCFVGRDGQQHILMADMDYPNGLVLSDDEQRLYVAESYQNRILVIDLRSAGDGGGGCHVFAELPQNKTGGYNLPDGLARDHQGNIWVAHYGMQALQVLSPEGTLLLSLDTGVPLTSNLTFIGKEKLLITGGFGEPGPGILLTYCREDTTGDYST